MNKEERTYCPAKCGRLYLTKEQAASMFGISVSTLDNYKRNNLIPYSKIGRAVRFTLFDLKNSLILQKKGKSR